MKQQQRVIRFVERGRDLWRMIFASNGWVRTVALCVGLAGAWALSSGSAAAGTWNSTNAGSWSDTSATGWNGAYPDAVGAVAIFNQNFAAAKTFTLDIDATVGDLTLACTAGNYALTLSGAKTLTFDAPGAGPATLSWARSSDDIYVLSTINVPVTLNDDLIATGSTSLQISGDIAGAGRWLTVNTETAVNQMRLTGNNTNLTGGIVVNASSSLKFGSLNSMGGGGNGTVLLKKGSVSVLNYSLNAAQMIEAIAKVNTNSAGMFGPAVNNGTSNYAIDLSGLKDIRFGTWYATFSLNAGTVLSFDFANNGNKYAIGGISIGLSSLNVYGANIFTGSHNLDLLPQYVYIRAAQDYSGTTTLSDNPFPLIQPNYHGNIYLTDNGTLLNTSAIIVNQGTSFIFQNNGAANLADRVNDAVPIAINGASLNLTGCNIASTASSETVGPITLSGGNSVSVNNGSGSSTILTAASLTRKGASVLSISLNLPVAQFLVSSGAPERLTLNATQVSMIAPYYVMSGNAFADYVPGSGFTNAVVTSIIADGTNPWADTSGTNIVELLGGATLGANNKVAALRLNHSANNKPLNISGEFTSIEIGSGGVIGPMPNITIDVKPRFIFGPNGTGEALFIVPAGALQHSGGLNAANGLTKSGAGRLTLLGDSSTTLLGPITLNTGELSFYGNNSFKPSPLSPVTINSGTLYLWDGSQPTVASVTLNAGTIAQGGNLNSPVKLTASSFTLYSGTVGVPLAGATATLVKDGAATVRLMATSTYGGATMVSNGILEVTGSIASTHLAISSGATLAFTGNIDLTGKTLTIDASGPTAGLLSVAGALTLGGDLIVTGFFEERKIAESTVSISGAFASKDLQGASVTVRNGKELWAIPPFGTMISIQ